MTWRTAGIVAEIVAAAIGTLAIVALGWWLTTS